MLPTVLRSGPTLSTHFAGEAHEAGTGRAACTDSTGWQHRPAVLCTWSLCRSCSCCYMESVRCKWSLMEENLARLCSRTAGPGRVPELVWLQGRNEDFFPGRMLQGRGPGSSGPGTYEQTTHRQAGQCWGACPPAPEHCCPGWRHRSSQVPWGPSDSLQEPRAARPLSQ